MHRTHTCGQLSAEHLSQEVTLSGWVANRRDHGGIIFIDLRDRYGITQVVFDPAHSSSAWEQADRFRSEYVVKLTGTVRRRPEGQENTKIATGEIEVIIHTAKILSESKTPPFELSDHAVASEDVRLKYRYIDIRRTRVLKNLMFRASVNQFARTWFSARNFLEVQTPIFTVSSPEGARDYLVPSRLHPGKFYALPQAPQQYKQLLMVGGVDRYFQIAPCFRDEDPRADRHSCEFYQLDCEMSFVEQDDIFAVCEAFLKDLIPATIPHKRLSPHSFARLTHREARARYGSDKPDLRFGMAFENFTTDFASTAFSVFAQAIAAGGVIKAMKLEDKRLTRSEIDSLTAVARAQGAGGLAYIVYEEDGPKSPILKFLSESEIAALAARFQPKVGDTIFFGAGDFDTVVKTLHAVRITLRDTLELVDKNELCFTWITDFPMYERKDDGTVDFEHNPFSMPHGGAEAFDTLAPEDIYGMQYDLACNGYEVLSGSIRNHDIQLLVRAFGIVGKGEAEVREKFGAMYSAFQYGVPPHGGFAFGLDRLMMIFMDEPNIREIYAFPKSGRAEDIMMNAPSFVDAEQLKELHIQLGTEARAEEEKYRSQLGNPELAGQIRALLAPFGVQFLEHEAVHTSQEASRVRGTDITLQAKALVLQSGSDWLMAVVPADMQLDIEALTAHTGKRYALVTPDDLRRRFGLVPGSVPPFGSQLGIPLVMHAGMAALPHLSFNIGLLTQSAIEVPMNVYLDIERPTQANIAKASK